MFREALFYTRKWKVLLTGIIFFVLVFLTLKNFFTTTNTEIKDGYLLWNSKCHMPLENPFDPTILRFVEKEEYQNCTNSPLLTSITSYDNGTNILMLNTNEIKNFKSIFCCWAPITRQTPDRLYPQKNVDSLISVKDCINFKNFVIIPEEVEVLKVSCTKTLQVKKIYKEKLINPMEDDLIYENVHSVINVGKVSKRLKMSELAKEANQKRKLSVLLLGIDNVSRLNFIRNLPKTKNYLTEKGWLTMKGYNKIGENTFPNLMAILTGHSLPEVYKICKPYDPYGLDYCPMLWTEFINANYITAFAEDCTEISTFNYMKTGFVDPPTDYYLRPYMLACEQMLKSQTKFDSSFYCTGPEVTAERIFDAGIEFAKRFKGHPYFGFFWTNSITHESIKGLSSMDSSILSRLENLEKEGITNDSMIIFISDHGMRTGEFRETFMGWYEERLPFFYIWLPEWFREEDPAAYQALTINQNQLSSPYDLYETLRDVLIRAGGEAKPSSGCPKCGSLFKTVAKERGCNDAGILPLWCTCNEFKSLNPHSRIARQGAKEIVKHINFLLQSITPEHGARLCSKLYLNKIYRIERIVDLTDDFTSGEIYFIIFDVKPGDAKYEVYFQYNCSRNIVLSDSQINRLNTYHDSSKCLVSRFKKFCYCKHRSNVTD